MSDVVASIEAEAEELIENAKRKAQAIIAEARVRAEGILLDDSYKKELEEFRQTAERNIQKEIREIMLQAEYEVKKIQSTPESSLERLAKKLASKIAGVAIE
ncbi:MAG: hypothetical protein RMH84_06990 [Sulfolobales archaeon]|nr:hypothetical protein [Sulfolobales archaeon]MCX8208704.1 hypothetical protein [Sulfolobales archaeon]MDW8011318.1 hypothetical protein [Sulfolobales archaeon]